MYALCFLRAHIHYAAMNEASTSRDSPTPEDDVPHIKVEDVANDDSAVAEAHTGTWVVDVPAATELVSGEKSAPGFGQIQEGDCAEATPIKKWGRKPVPRPPPPVIYSDDDTLGSRPDRAMRGLKLTSIPQRNRPNSLSPMKQSSSPTLGHNQVRFPYDPSTGSIAVRLARMKRSGRGANADLIVQSAEPTASMFTVRKSELTTLLGPPLLSPTAVDTQAGVSTSTALVPLSSTSRSEGRATPRTHTADQIATLGQESVVTGTVLRLKQFEPLSPQRLGQLYNTVDLLSPRSQLPNASKHLFMAVPDRRHVEGRGARPQPDHRERYHAMEGGITTSPRDRIAAPAYIMAVAHYDRDFVLRHFAPTKPTLCGPTPTQQPDTELTVVGGGASKGSPKPPLAPVDRNDANATFVVSSSSKMPKDEAVGRIHIAERRQQSSSRRSGARDHGLAVHSGGVGHSAILGGGLLRPSFLSGASTHMHCNTPPLPSNKLPWEDEDVVTRALPLKAPHERLRERAMQEGGIGGEAAAHGDVRRRYEQHQARLLAATLPPEFL